MPITTAEIAIIDTRIDAVIGQIRVADVPHQFVISGIRAKLVATHLDAQAITIFDLEKMQIEAVLRPGYRPEQLELDRTRARRRRIRLVGAGVQAKQRDQQRGAERRRTRQQVAAVDPAHGRQAMRDLQDFCSRAMSIA